MDTGLSTLEARERLATSGPNEIERAAGPDPFTIFVRQFHGPMVWLLAGAAAIAGAFGEVADAIAIAVILVLNAAIGFVQEHRAEKAVTALRSLTAPRARVRRDGQSMMIPAAQIVPGDLLVLEAGDLIAADARLRQAHALSTNEAALTGESVPASKSTAAVSAQAPLAERRDRVFMGTAVATGSGLAEVIATGMRTELGRIAHLIGTARSAATPLQNRIARVGRTLLVACLAIVLLVALLGLLRGQPWSEVLMASVSLAVAAVPEGLAAIVTVALALGVQRMAERNVLVRRLASVETLGCATVICTDKTGTLTTGSMVARELWGIDHRALLDAAAACCDADLGPAGGTGDPTEIALLAAAAERGIFRPDIERDRPRVDVVPFDSISKRMAIRRGDGKLYVKGAVESVLPLCHGEHRAALAANEDMAGRGMRVLAVAVGDAGEERDLRLLGLVALADPPRAEAIAAVAQAHHAGIHTVMITGDHPATARAIAREMDIARSDADLAARVFARVTPEDKLRIVRDLKARGEVVAMTGDGVNDAPALKEAHIGVAMGKTGTEVAREASAMILADDNFASIIDAVREGRGIFENIRKTLVYLLTGNASELAIMLGAVVVGLPIPLLPLQILWINLVTDGLPALALVMDPAAPDVLDKPPRRSTEQILGWREWRLIGLTALIEAVVVVGVFVWALRERPVTEARSIAFSVLVFAEVFRAFAARSPAQTYWQVGAFTNLWLVGVVALTTFIQLAMPHLRPAQELFELVPLSGPYTLLTIGLGLIPVTVLELAKLVRRTPSATCRHEHTC